MENPYTHLIEQEEAKIALLRAKIAECERRIELLSTFLKADELDTLLSKSLELDVQRSEDNPPVQAQQSVVLHVATEGHDLPKRRLSDDVQSILRFIGAEGKSLDELEAFCAARGISHNRGSLRSLASNYKNKHGFVASPRLGFFQLTERGVNFLNMNYPVAQDETPPVDAGGVSSTSTQAALDGGTESDGLV